MSKKTLENILFLFSMQANCESNVDFLWHYYYTCKICLVKTCYVQFKTSNKNMLSIGKYPSPLIVECSYKF